VRLVEAVYARFGRDLQRLRKQRKLSQSDLARLIDPTGERLSRSSIANIETGKQRVALHLFLEIAQALKIEPAELLPASSGPIAPIVERARNLSPPEQEWLTRIVAPPRKRRRSASANGA
jgi:transcriptional regulator with XRE-family HTH domain